MKRFLLFFLVFIMVLGVSGQSLSVAHFVRLDNDFDARVNHPVRDPNGKVCALIKVENVNAGFQFTTGTIDVVKTEAHSGETWVYVQPGVRKMTISHPSFGILRDYAFPMSIEEATTYLLILRSPMEEQGSAAEYKPQTGLVFFKSKPDGADVFLNDERKGTTPYIAQFNLGETISWRLEKKLYEPEGGELTISSPQEKVDLRLKHNKAYYQNKGRGFINASFACPIGSVAENLGYFGLMGGFLYKWGGYAKAMMSYADGDFLYLLSGGAIKSLSSNWFLYAGFGHGSISYKEMGYSWDRKLLGYFYVDKSGYLVEGGIIFKFTKFNCSLGYTNVFAEIEGGNKCQPILNCSLGYCF